MNWAIWVSIGAIFAALGVGLGAFGAHGLKGRVDPEMLQVFKTASEYQMLHALGIITIGLVSMRLEGTWINIAGALMVLGTLLFSGSLYALVFTANRSLGIITPFGGASLILSWLVFAAAVIRVSI